MKTGYSSNTVHYFYPSNTTSPNFQQPISLSDELLLQLSCETLPLPAVGFMLGYLSHCWELLTKKPKDAYE